MESSSQQLISTLNRITILLNLSDDPLCWHYRDQFKELVAQLSRPHEPKRIASTVLSTYGGMCTFSDAGIWKDGNRLKNDDDEFRDLRTKLYKLCEEIVATDG